ncbi:hypothetical protein L0A91_05805 [Ornithinimicrobium sp. INDO-MA30-4]|nr:hypothetical protein [Ornithinimicrobium sp. INDO-MA30-4]UJH71589.1 hypothetical protein L0A91_05805 [Ornithinimicrobium sp. INDO-MA30-4]
MDAFYASVSLLDHPHLADKPVIVGGGWRSVVLSATYPARAAGVRSGIPVAQAKGCARRPASSPLTTSSIQGSRRQ